MRRLAKLLDLEPARARWDELVPAATFQAMRERADNLAPDPAGIFYDADRFFRRGRSGEGALLLTPAELSRYRERVKALAPPDLLAWLHR
jgi:aryl sulfotransferase